jgi:hypothetical protein
MEMAPTDAFPFYRVIIAGSQVAQGVACVSDKVYVMGATGIHDN